MNKTALFKALRFAFLPTAVVLLLMMFGFFSITKVFDFISSSHGGAIAIRILLFVLETVLIVVMYHYYLKKLIFEGAIKNPELEMISGTYQSSSEYIRHLFKDGSSSDKYTKYTTKDDNIIVIKRTPKINL